MKRENFKANYNGEPIGSNEVMIPFEYTELDAENCTNPECIRSVKQGGKSFRVIYKAVPSEFAKIGTSALSLKQNEDLGHYTYANSVSMDAVSDEHGLSLDSVPSAEECVMAALEFSDAAEKFRAVMSKLTEKHPGTAYAVLLLMEGIKGSEFHDRMRLTHNPANRVRKNAELILRNGLGNLDTDSLTGYKNKNDEYYRAEVRRLIARILSDCR